MINRYLEKLNEVKCDICGISLCGKTVLRNHLKNVHGSEKLKQCKTCGKYSKNLYRHMWRNHVKIKEKHKCRCCSKIFNDKAHLKRHIDFIHKNISTNKCDFCEKLFQDKCDLKKHMASKHHNEIPI